MTRVYGHSRHSGSRYDGDAMPLTLLAGVLLVLLGGSEDQLDCAHIARSRSLIDLLRLAELEYAEDVHREAFWAALGQCPPGPAGTGCRAREQGTFDARWREQRAGIDAKYRRMHDEFETRCRTTIG